MHDALAGRVALVTGASRGIGAAIARRFGAEGARVAIVARSLEPGSGGHLAGSLQETGAAITEAGGTALPIAADLSDPACDRAAIVATVERDLGPVDMLVNNAAACFYLSIDETSERRLRLAYEVNVITPYLLTKAVVPGMRARGAGWIVNITSAIVDPTDSPQQARSSTYAPSKAALDRLTLSFASEFRGQGIAVNAVAPRAAVRTEGATAMMDLPDEMVEPMDTMVDAVLALATCDPERESGRVVRSISYLAERGMSALEGKTALVTGAGRGIGQAIARLFAERGASVVVADVDHAAAIGTTRSVTGNAVAVEADVTDDGAVAAMVKTAVDRFGGLDYAVNNAGIAPDAKPFVDHSLAEWQRTIDIDLTGVFLCMQHELRQFVAQRRAETGRRGAIVNISSAAGVVPAPGQPQYTAAKHGVLGLTKQAAQEYASSGVRVNAVLPGQTETDPMRAYLDALPDQGEKMLRRLPMGRMATPDEIAQTVVWLCSDDAAYVNGVALLVDGGLIAR